MTLTSSLRDLLTLTHWAHTSAINYAWYVLSILDVVIANYNKIAVANPNEPIVTASWGLLPHTIGPFPFTFLQLKKYPDINTEGTVLQHYELTENDSTLEKKIEKKSLMCNWNGSKWSRPLHHHCSEDWLRGSYWHIHELEKCWLNYENKSPCFRLLNKPS